MPSRYTATGRVLALGGDVSYRTALLALSPTYAWLAGDVAAGAVAAWPCAVTGVQATQATEGARPTASATALNGKPGLTFDGGDWLKTAAFASALAQPYSVVIAMSMSAGTTLPDVFFDGIEVGARGLFGVGTLLTVRRLQGNFGGGIVVPYTTSEFQLGVAVTTRFRAVGASSAIALNGVEQTPINGGTHALTGATIGAAYDNAAPLVGVIADILIFSGADYAARAASADALMRAYYGI
jgi:hypothetical protein